MRDTKLSKMGHQRPLEDQTVERSEEPYAGPERSERHRRERTVAIVGASGDRHKFGNKAVRAYGEDGYTVWPVNPKGGEIEGAQTFSALDDLPGLPFIASIYLHEDAAMEALETLAAMEQQAHDHIAVIYLNPGADTPAVRQRAAELGLFALATCSVRAIGKEPTDFADE